MFFSYHILVRKNSNFALIWRFMHEPKRANRNELLTFDIVKACDDLKGYIPSGTLSRQELQNKMSLYLLGQLMHGITLVYRFQANALYQFANEAVKNLMRVPTEEKKRKRASLIEEEEDDDLFLPKKKRVSKQRTTHSVLDLNDPRSYVDDPIIRSLDREYFIGVDDNFQANEVHIGPGESFLEIQNEIKEYYGQQRVKDEEEHLDFDVSLKDPKVSIGSFNFPRESIEGMRAASLSMYKDVAPMKESFIGPDYVENESEPQLPNIPVYRQDAADSASQEESQDFMLEPLSIKSDAGEVVRRRKRKHLIFDEITELPFVDIQEQLNDYSDTLRKKDEIIVHADEWAVPSLNDLLNPRPCHIKNLNPNLYPLFDSVLRNVKERPLTFEEAAHCDLQELRKRRFDILDVDLRTWTSDTLQESRDEQVQNAPQDQYVPDLDAPLQRPSGPLESIAEEEPQPVDQHQKVSVADMSGLVEEPEFEIHRRQSSGNCMQRSLPEADDFMDKSGNLLIEDEFTQVRYSDSNRIDYETAERLSQRSFEKHETQEFYRELVATGNLVNRFSEMLGERPTRLIASRKFSILLSLLKQQEVKVRQIEPYGEILIKLRD